MIRRIIQSSLKLRTSFVYHQQHGLFRMLFFCAGKIHGECLCHALATAATLRVSILSGPRTNAYFGETVVLNKTPIPGIFAKFIAAQVEKKKFKPVTRSKISILFRTLGSEVYHLYSGTQYRGKAAVRSLSSLKACFFYSFFF